MTSEELILILAKTYPVPSEKYSETSCVAGITDKGLLRRLYPVPFRLIADEQQFRKWEWVRAKVTAPYGDGRPESRRIYIDTIKCDHFLPSDKNGWKERVQMLDRIPRHSSPDALEAARKDSGVSLGLVDPIEIVGLDIEAVEPPIWTEEEARKLVQMQLQTGLFSGDERSELKALPRLRKVPFNFYYRCRFNHQDAVVDRRLRITDWEIGALYWNCKASSGDRWEVPFRQKMEQFLPKRNLSFLLGNVHQHPHRWLVVSLLYPPRPTTDERQLPLL